VLSIPFHRQINHKYRKQQLSKSIGINDAADEIVEIVFLTQWLDYLHPSQMKNVQLDGIDDVKGSSLLAEMRDLFNMTSSR